MNQQTPHPRPRRYSTLVLLLSLGTLAGWKAGSVLTAVSTPSLELESGPAAGAVRSSTAGELTAMWELVYVGSSTCAWSTSPRTRVAVKAFMDSVAELASETGINLSTVGVDLDPRSHDPIAHLVGIEQFHQYSVGGSFLNAVALGIADSNGEVVGTPTVVLSARLLTKFNERGDPLSVAISEERTLLRLVGIDQLEEINFAALRAMLLHRNEGETR